MNINPIIIVDDDPDDLELITEAFTELKVQNELIVFDNGSDFLEYMRKTEKKIFFILCDVNMQKINGLEMKKAIAADDRLRLKCVPFLFISTSKSSPEIERAYSYNVQGYFVKPLKFEQLVDMLRSMVVYWGYSLHPNS